MQSIWMVTWSRSRLSTFGMAVASTTPIMPDIERRGVTSTPLAFQVGPLTPTLSPLRGAREIVLVEAPERPKGAGLSIGRRGFAAPAHFSKIRRGARGGPSRPPASAGGALDAGQT